LQSLDQLNDNLLHEIEHFFISYNAAKGKAFAPKGRFGPNKARRVIDEGEKQFRKRKTT
jgi:inorganic pyrophosphatase